MSRSPFVKSGGRATYIWWQGDLLPWEDATVHVRSVGHASVSSVFEGLRAHWDDSAKILRVFRLRDHLRRFIESAMLARLDNRWTVQGLQGAVCDLLRANAYREDVYVRPWMFVDGVIGEVITPENLSTVTVIDSWPLNTARGQHQQPLRACVSSWRRSNGGGNGSKIKAFANYHQARLATAEAHRGGYDAPIFLNDAGLLTEGSGACLGFVRDNKLVTPPVSAGILEGITRDTLLTLAREDLGLEVEVRNADRLELAVADEAFFMGTGWGIRPIGELDGHRIGDGEVGRVTTSLTKAYRRAVLGHDSGGRGWVTEVGQEGSPPA